MKNTKSLTRAFLRIVEGARQEIVSLDFLIKSDPRGNYQTSLESLAEALGRAGDILRILEKHDEKNSG